MTGEPVTIGGYLIGRLQQLGIEHVFGVPGDYVLRFFDLLERSALRVVNTCDEQGAGFAADAYARIRGIGAVCITYGVGGLKVVNTTAQAYAEESPVVVISGAPGVEERRKHPLLHHKARAFETQREVFDRITAASAVLDDPGVACREIDRVLRVALIQKLPVYIELPRDRVLAEAPRPDSPLSLEAPAGDPDATRAAVAEVASLLSRAERPVILAGVEVQRFGLQDHLERLVSASNIPVATTLLGKSVIGERHPSFIGLYQGGMGREDVRDYVESSDCIMMLGALQTDLDLGIFTARLDPHRTVHATRDRVAVGYHGYENVRLADFIEGVAAAGLPRCACDRPRPQPAFSDEVRSEGTVTVSNLFAHLAAFLTEETMVIADPGDALFAAADLPVHRRAEFMSSAYYASLGFAVPAALGAQLAAPLQRPLVLVGDGAFQMTGMELSTIARYRLNPVVVVLNNGGYGTERPMLDGSFNDVLPWQYYRIPEVLGAGRGFLVETTVQLDAALEAASAARDAVSLLDVQLAPDDRSPALKRLTAALAASVRGSG
jgi:indolepyruvate decarboxylase